MRVLLVEDNTELVSLLKKGLLQGGIEADAVGTAGDADHVLATMQYSAVVLDLGLPDEDGITLLRDLRRRGESTPVLVLTARDGVSDRVTGLRAGADDYLAKPFDFTELLARVRALDVRLGGLDEAAAPLVAELVAGLVHLLADHDVVEPELPAEEEQHDHAGRDEELAHDADDADAPARLRPLPLCAATVWDDHRHGEDCTAVYPEDWP